MKPPPLRPRAPAARHEIAIAADPATVWAILADFARWGDWNPLYIRTQGRLVPGERIDFTVAVPGMKPMDARATVYRAERPRLIEYGLSNAAGLLKAFRFVDLVPDGAGGCRVINGEFTTGPLGVLVRKLLGAKVTLGLKEMNEALKARAEAAAR